MDLREMDRSRRLAASFARLRAVTVRVRHGRRFPNRAKTRGADRREMDRHRQLAASSARLRGGTVRVRHDRRFPNRGMERHGMERRGMDRRRQLVASFARRRTSDRFNANSSKSRKAARRASRTSIGATKSGTAVRRSGPSASARRVAASNLRCTRRQAAFFNQNNETRLVASRVHHFRIIAR